MKWSRNPILNAIRVLDEVTPARLFVLLVIGALVVLHGLVPTQFVVDGITIGLIGVLVIVVLVPLLKSATLPGGARLEFREKLDRLQREAEAAADSQPVAAESHPRQDTRERLPSSEVAAGQTAKAHLREDERGDELTARILDEAARSPKVGLMLLAAELERASRQLLAATGWMTPEAGRSLRAGIQRLVGLGVMPPSLPSAVDLFMSIRNEVVHGRQRVNDDEILRAVDAGLTILRAIDAVPRERHVVVAVQVPVFADEELQSPIDDATGVVLKSISPGGLSFSRRIFPTTRTHFTVGREVAWEWNPERQWGAAWYTDDDAAVKPAWTGSLEFIGRHIDDV
jgi:hypothetical protein